MTFVDFLRIHVNLPGQRYKLRLTPPVLSVPQGVILPPEIALDIAVLQRNVNISRKDGYACKNTPRDVRPQREA